MRERSATHQLLDQPLRDSGVGVSAKLDENGNNARNGKPVFNATKGGKSCVTVATSDASQGAGGFGNSKGGGGGLRQEH